MVCCFTRPARTFPRHHASLSCFPFPRDGRRFSHGPLSVNFHRERLLLQAIYIGVHTGITGCRVSLLLSAQYSDSVPRLCVNVHRLCVENCRRYPIYAYADTPFMRGRLLGCTPPCGSNEASGESLQFRGRRSAGALSGTQAGTGIATGKI